LIQLAIFNNDLDLLSYLIALGEDFSVKSSTDTEHDSLKTTAFNIGHSTFLYALQSNCPHLLAELIKRTGAGIPLNKFAKASGVEATEKPKYYQGLSVYGKKRKDWADAGMNTAVYEPVEYHRPPLLEASHYGVLDTVEWLMSDAPLRCYRQFAGSHADDKRLQLLAKSKKGFEGFVKKFLGTHSTLALHSAVIAQPSIESLELLQYLAEAMPEALEAKNVDGLTPLAVAFDLYRHDAAKILIQAGADQTARTKGGKNLVHLLLEHADVEEEKHFKQLRVMMDLIDKRLLPSMFVERCSQDPGTLTPLALWLRTAHFRNSEWEIKVLQFILSYSKGRELGLLNGEGDTPLHVMVRTSNPWRAEVVLEAAPELVNRENAVGRTPYEMAEDQEIASMCFGPPVINRGSPSYIHRRGQGRYNSITDVAPHDFVKPAKDEADDGEPAEYKTCWFLVKQAKARLEAEGKSKRRLVTLSEANVVAERIAQAKASRTRHGRSVMREDGSDVGGEEAEEEEEESAIADEVSTWMASAARWDGPWNIEQE